MGKVMMHAVVSVDGYIADPHDDVGPLFDWYWNGDQPLEHMGMKLSRASYDYTRPMWDAIGATIQGRHLFDLTDGWDASPPAGEHLVVVSHRPKPEGWHPEADVPFFDDIAAAVAEAKQRAGDRIVAVCAGEVGGQALALGLVDEVAMDVVPVVFGTGKRYFGGIDAQHLLEDPDVVIQGDRVLHLRYRVRG
jgi:dihydrofolate reductase